jgi:hypothetical protein
MKMGWGVGGGRGKKYSSTLSLNLGARMGWAVNVTPQHFTPKKKTWYPSCRRLSGPQGQAEWIQIILPPPRLDLWTVQPIASYYTDYNIPANTQYCIEIHFCLSLNSSSLFAIFFFQEVPLLLILGNSREG